ncbi:ROK family protein [Salinisphaera sp.]|uniref:ROK family transcriptional regulator n=1 Tax=Salinisphaera sp. TaxID=1914330 RepID=UPI002D785067|nr:ROK family protein [Salinisphaera sp.]HET7313942.1 ROK family protein [Salinisphaera sp.]
MSDRQGPVAVSHGTAPETVITEIDRAFFRHLIEHGPGSRAGISAAIGIARPTASESARRLLGAGLIRPAGQQTGQRGRAPLLYAVNAERGYTLSLAMDRGWVGLRACDLARRVVWEKIVPLAVETSGEQLIATSRDLLAQARAKAHGDCLGATCSVADPVDPDTGAVVSLPDSPFPAGHIAIRERIFTPDVPILRVDNDVNWAALAESRLGVMRSQRNFLYVYIGAGVGAALYVNGALYRGATGLAGEIGYARLGPAQTLMQRLQELDVALPDRTSLDSARLQALFETEADSRGAGAVVEAFAWVIANTAITLNPGAIVLAGSLMDMPSFNTQLQRAVQSNLPMPVEIHVSRFGARAPLVGAGIGAQEAAEIGLGLAAGPVDASA